MKRSNYQSYIDQLQQRKEELENQVDAKDPFNSGVMKAIESSKASLGLSRDQEHKAIRKGINTFSARLSEKFGNPFMRKKGFVDNLASVAPAASAGLEAYDDAEDEIKHDNQKMYEWAKKFRDDELKRLEATDKEGYDRYMADKKLGLEQEKLAEMKEYHQGLLEKEKKKLTIGDLTPKLAESKKFIPLTNEHMKNRIAKKYDTSVDLLDEVKQLENNYKILEKMLDDRGILNHPLFLNKFVNRHHDWVSTLFANEQDKELLAQVGVVNSISERLAMHYEAEDRKRGVTDFMVKYSNDSSLYPSIKRPTAFKAQLDQLKKNVELSVFTTEESLRNGYDINKSNYKDYLKIYNAHHKPTEPTSNDRIDNMQSIQQIPNNVSVDLPLNVNDVQKTIPNSLPKPKNKVEKDDKVLMLDPKTGQKDWIHRDWVQDAIDKDGLQVVYEQF